MKVGRSVSRLTRKRERQLRPLTIGSFVPEAVCRDLGDFFRWDPAKNVRAPLHRAARRCRR